MTWLPKLVIGRVVPLAVRNALAASDLVAGARVRSTVAPLMSFLSAAFLLVSYKR